jgi:cytochrome c oxidase subunit 1
MVTGLIIIIVNLIRSARHGVSAEMNPWKSKTLEWTVPSPPPLENFDIEPVIEEKDGPYIYE